MFSWLLEDRAITKIVIRRPVHDVFAYVTDVERWPEWSYYKMDARLNSGTSRQPGATYDLWYEGHGTRTHIRATVLTIEDDRRFVYRGSISTWIKHFVVAPEVTYEFSRHGDGETLLEFTSVQRWRRAALLPPLLMFVLVKFALTPILHHQYGKTLENAKRVLESDAS